MPNESDTRSINIRPYPFWLKAPLILIGICLMGVIMIYGKFILMPLAFAAILSMLLNPVIQLFASWKNGRVMSILIALVLISLFFAGFLALIIVQLVQFAENLPEAADRLNSVSENMIKHVENISGISEIKLTEYLDDSLESNFISTGEYLMSLAKVTKDTIIFLSLLPVFIFFMLYYKEMYRVFLEKAFIKSQNEEIDTVIKRVRSVTQSYLAGLFTIMCIMAVMNSIGLLIIGLDYAVFFAVFASFLALIPYIGAILGMLPAFIYALLFGDSLLLPLLVIVIFTSVQFIEGSFLTPKIVGSQVSINPFVAIIVLIIGGEIWGIGGMILFIPLIGIVRVGFSQVPVLKPYGYLLGNIIDYEKSKEKIS